MDCRPGIQGPALEIRALNKPLSYRIRNVVPGRPRITKEVGEELKSGKTSDPAPAFRIVADVDFMSEANTVITNVLEYNLTWSPKQDDWSIMEE